MSWYWYLALTQIVSLATAGRCHGIGISLSLNYLSVNHWVSIQDKAAINWDSSSIVHDKSKDRLLRIFSPSCFRFESILSILVSWSLSHFSLVFIILNLRRNTSADNDSAVQMIRFWLDLSVYFVSFAEICLSLNNAINGHWPEMETVPPFIRIN